MECKLRSGKERVLKNGCINRNIMECKFKRASIRKTAKKGINRNIMECKCYSSIC